MCTDSRFQVRHLEAIMRISEAFCKMRLSEYCTSQDVDRAIAVTVDSFVGGRKSAVRRRWREHLLSMSHPVVTKSRVCKLLTRFKKVHASEARLAEESEWEEWDEDWACGNSCDGLVLPSCY